jgi:hypothetical protein
MKNKMRNPKKCKDMITNRNNTFFIRVAIFLLFSSICINCNEPDKMALAQKEKVDELNPIFWREYNEVFGLLSAKYNIGVDTVENISVEYMRFFVPLEYSMLLMNSSKKDTTAMDYFMNPRQSVEITITQAALKYKLERSKVASILFDFRLFFAKKEPGTSY